MLLFTGSAFVQNVRGGVADETGQKLPGVSVVLKGTQKGTSTKYPYPRGVAAFEEPVALFGIQNPEASFRNIVLKDITMQGAGMSLVKGNVSGVIFNNVKVNGKAIASEADIPLREGSLPVRNASYLPVK